MPNMIPKVAEIAPETRPVPPTQGGAIQQFIYDFALYLKDRLDITIYTRYTPQQEKDFLKYISINFNRLENCVANALRGNKMLEFLPLRLILKAILVSSYIMKCVNRMDYKYDIFHVHNNPNFVPFLRECRPYTSIVLHMNNRHFTSKRYSQILKPFYRHWIKLLDRLVCVSRFIRDDIVGMYPEAADKTIVVYNGVNTEKFIKRDNQQDLKALHDFGLEANTTKILFAGRLTRQKGVHTLLEAVSRIKKGDFQLILAGSRFFADASQTSDYERGLKDAAMGLGNRVHFLGFVNQEDMARLYSASEICVVPSLPLTEACPFVLLEAMSSSCCVIASNAQPMTEIVKNGSDGILFEPENPVALANALEMAILDRNMRLALGKNARKTVEDKFSHRIIFGQLLDLLMEEYSKKKKY